MIFYKKLIFILCFIFCKYITKNSEWQVDQIYSLFPKEKNLENIIIDPNNYLSPNIKKGIYYRMEEINTKKKLKNILIVMDTISYDFWSRKAGKKDIIKFSELLIFKIFHNIKERDISILTIYSIEDRIYRIRTGYTARQFITDTETSFLAEEMKANLKNRNYNDAFKDLFIKMEKCSVGGDKSVCQQDNTGLIIVLFVVFFGWISYLIIGCRNSMKERNRKRIQRDLRKKFKTIKEIKESGQNIDLYIQENCVVCLETLDQDNRNKGENDPFREIVLKCGHNFHQNCISAWKMRNSDCPICRLKIEFVSNNRIENLETPIINQQNTYYRNDSLDLLLFEIQRTRYDREFNSSEMSDMYHSNKWSWVNYNTSYNNNNDSSWNWNNHNSGGGGGFSYDTNCGGTSGGW